VTAVPATIRWPERDVDLSGLRSTAIDTELDPEPVAPEVIVIQLTSELAVQEHEPFSCTDIEADPPFYLN